MRYFVLASDYDGTLAQNGQVEPVVNESLKRLKASGRKIILVTGRELDDLFKVYPEHEIFDLIVAENGALIYDPSTNKEMPLGERPPESFIQSLRDQNVSPLSVGRVIVATWEPWQNVVLEAIRQAGLELQVIFNKGAVMVLPPGVNKASGLFAALKAWGISAHNVVAVGDAENDNALLKFAECAVAVNNALDSVKEGADLVTPSARGQGVCELITKLVEEDLAELAPRLSRHFLNVGVTEDQREVHLSPYGTSLLLCGSSGAGKTTFTAAILESLQEKNYQYCLIDPEGDYLDLEGLLVLGDTRQPPLLPEIIQAMESPEQNVAICLLAIDLNDRPSFFKEVLLAILDLRLKTGHPHFVILDEAHHLMPSEMDTAFFPLPAEFSNFIAITVEPAHVNKALLDKVNTFFAIGAKPAQALRDFAATLKLNPSIPEMTALEKGKVLAWRVTEPAPWIYVSRKPTRLLKRHQRKYATGDMETNSFVFKGPDARLNLPANNLLRFIELGRGLDDETWLYHLRRHDYSIWMSEAVNDTELGDAVGKIEDSEKDNPISSRKEIFQQIEARYTKQV